MYLVPVTAIEPQHHVDAFRTYQESTRNRRAAIATVREIEARNRLRRNHYCPAGA